MFSKLSARAFIPKTATRECSSFRKQHRRNITPLLPIPDIEGCYSIQTHQPCFHNELRSLFNRHLKHIPVEPTRRGIRSVHRELLALNRLIGPLRPCSLETLLAKVSSRKKRLYTTAAESLHYEEITTRDARVKMFIKPDRYSALEVGSKEPRAIQYRSPRYNLRLQQFLHPFEWAYYRTCSSTRGGPVKGLNSWQRAKLYVESMKTLDDPVVVNLDFSKFDAHLHPSLLQEEIKCYCRTFPDQVLRDLLMMQVHNKCTTQLGTPYFVYGSRMSGDVNTGLGNTMIAEAIVRAWAKHHGVKCIPFVDGDDVVCIMERNKVPALDFLDYGMEATAELLEVDQLTHCQSKIIWMGDVPRMIRNPLRAISHGCGTVKFYPNNVLRPLLSAMGHSELACSSGCPVLQEWALAQIRVADTTPWDKFDEALMYRAKLEGQALPRPVTTEARESFWNCFGISIADQLHYERMFQDLGPKDFLPARGVDASWYETKASAWEA